MLFEMNFEVIEIHDNGGCIVHFLRGKRSDIKKDVDKFRQYSKKYEMVGKKAMIVWA